MGQTTANMGIYIPAAGETNYDSSFFAGMVNVDQHDHSGGPNKGVTIASSGLSDGAVTFEKLNANVVDSTTGIDTASGGSANKLIMLGLLKSIYQIATTNGYIVKNGSNSEARTLTGTANGIDISNGDGTAGNPVFSLPATIHTDISFDTGTTTLNDYRTGTFTPLLQFGGNSAGMTYTTQLGKYWRIGSVVYFNIRIILLTKGISTGNANVAGLPFTSAADGHYQAISIQAFLNTYIAGANYIVGEIDPNTTLMNVVGCGPATQAAITNTQFANTSQLTISGFYWVA